jgi:hypothetical protein
VAFDADAFLRAREPWVLTVGGRQFMARPVSIAQVLTFQQAVTAANGDAVATAKAMTALLRAAFPPRWSYLLPGRDPVRLVLALDQDAQGAVLADFFGYLVRTTLRQRGTTRTTRPSPPSSVPTPPPPGTMEEAVAPV